MATYSIQQLTRLKQKVAALEKEVSKEQRKLLALPAKLGFHSVDALITALQSAAKAGGAVRAKARRSRAKITPEMKARLKELVAAKKTGREIAGHLKISVPSVQNIKKELGLVKKR